MSYPKPQLVDCADHIVDPNFRFTYTTPAASQVYGLFGTAWSFRTSRTNETQRTSAFSDGSIANNGSSGVWCRMFSAWYGKLKLDFVGTKLTMEINYIIGLKTANVQHNFGLFLADSTTTQPHSTANRKYLVRENNGNFILIHNTDGLTDVNLVDSGVGSDTSIHKHKFTWLVASGEYWIDGTSKGTHTTTTPVANMNPVFHIRNTSGVAQTSPDELEYWHVKVE